MRYELLKSKRLGNRGWPMEATFLHHPKRNWVKDSRTAEWGVVKGDNVVDVPGIYSSLGPLGESNPWVTLNAMRVLK